MDVNRTRILSIVNSMDGKYTNHVSDTIKKGKMGMECHIRFPTRVPEYQASRLLQLGCKTQNLYEFIYDGHLPRKFETHNVLCILTHDIPLHRLSVIKDYRIGSWKHDNRYDQMCLDPGLVERQLKKGKSLQKGWYTTESGEIAFRVQIDNVTPKI